MQRAMPWLETFQLLDAESIGAISSTSRRFAMLARPMRFTHFRFAPCGLSVTVPDDDDNPTSEFLGEAEHQRRTSRLDFWTYDRSCTLATSSGSRPSPSPLSNLTSTHGLIFLRAQQASPNSLGGTPAVLPPALKTLVHLTPKLGALSTTGISLTRPAIPNTPHPLDMFHAPAYRYDAPAYPIQPSQAALLGRSQPQRPQAPLPDPRLVRDPALARIDPALWPPLTDADQLQLVDAVKDHMAKAEAQALQDRLVLPQGPVYDFATEIAAPPLPAQPRPSPSPTKPRRGRKSTGGSHGTPTKPAAAAAAVRFDPIHNLTPASPVRGAAVTVVRACALVCCLTPGNIETVVGEAWKARNGGDVTKAVCPGCGAGFASKKGLKGHLVGGK
ncbi:hypothetical protein MIND_00395600 [Mycena indigotica]|uniref:Uncharacterized protein n=1 Tax=Mycena indigotica TaxID=2126181 RepID=A0A8H6T3I0_9AGAR|nr:uncharacterized protein MIND_00395600 [Mycena indigotica]KAF7310219.1 hypothetical protein MIND_00395600 [Mycena indigotica]